MITRDNSPRKVMLISDHWLDNERKRMEPYSEPSQTSLKDDLLKSSIQASKSVGEDFLLNSLTICYTYLFNDRYASNDIDFKKSIVTKRTILEGEDHLYVQITWLKDVWVTKSIYSSIMDCLQQIREVQPELIIIAGKWAFLFLAAYHDHPEEQLATVATTKRTDKDKKFFGKLLTFRASLLALNPGLGIKPTVVYPIITPAFHFIVKEKSFIIQMDYNKLARLYIRLCLGEAPEDILNFSWNPIVGDTKEKVLTYLGELKAKLNKEPTLTSIDVETRQGAIDCIGLAYEEDRSLTIPFSYMEAGVILEEGIRGIHKTSKGTEEIEIPVNSKVRYFKNFWSLEDELEVITKLWEVMRHPNCLHVGQNYLYDCSWYLFEWKLRLDADVDTMILHHALYNYLQKDLALLASLYCEDYAYWKGEIDSKENNIRWIYNGKDCMYTLKVANLLKQVMAVQSPKLQEFYKFQQYEVAPQLLTMMGRGVKVDVDRKEALRVQFSGLMQQCEEQINWIFNEKVNLNSTVQVARAFKQLLGIKPVINKKTKRETYGAEAMKVYLEMYPEWRTLLTLILEYKSIQVFVRTFLSAKVDPDGHMRCSYNPAGTKTYRLSSRKNAFDRGMNLANVPSKGKISLHYALMILKSEELGEDYEELEVDFETVDLVEEVAHAN